ncbi:MAG: AMP-binding protein [Microbacterium sp.]
MDTNTAQLPLGFWNVAAAHPTRPAVIDSDGTVTTFGELLERSRSIANTLRGFDIMPGDHIAAMLPNHRSIFEVFLAAFESGLIVIPVNSHLAAAEVAYVLQDSDAKAFFTHADLAEVAKLAADAAEVPHQRRYSVGDIATFRPYSELLEGPPTVPDPRTAGTTMMYTSGTTGKPKGVARRLTDVSPDSVYGPAAEITCRGFGVPVGPHTHLVCGPLYHAGPFVGAFNSLHVGGTIVVMDRWTPEGCLALIEQHRIAATQMVPTMFHRLVSLPDETRAAADVSSIRSVFHTGAPCPTSVKQKMMDWWGPVVYETYGGTEGAATIATPQRWLKKPGTVGKAIHGVTVHILGEDGGELAPDEIGEIWIESAIGPSEYYKDPEKTSKMRRGRMITLGDVGYLDADGCLFLRDRKIDMIISGGANVYPAEVEAALLEDPVVADAAVIGVPDEEWGEQVKAIVELKPGVDAGPDTESEIIDRCRTLIARFKCPRSIDFVDQLPRLPNGKVEKRRLRTPYWSERDSNI